MTAAERKARSRAAKAIEQGVGKRVPQSATKQAKPPEDDILHRLTVNPREAARQIQGSEDGVQALRYTRAELDAAFAAGGMFVAAQQALRGASHLRGVVDEWAASGPPLLWLFQVALSGSPWAEEAEAAGWLGGSPT